MSAAPTTTKNNSKRRSALNFAAGTLWHLPGSFGIVRILGLRYSLRCVLFHDVADAESSFTSGLGITITRRNFEAALKFIVRYYTPVSLQDVLTDCDGQGLPPRPLLVTFDDAYRSVSEFAAPLCAKFKVPAVFFVNGICLDNRQLALDNLVCYVANVCGLGTINAAIRAVDGAGDFAVRSLAQVFSHFLPMISLRSRDVFCGTLIKLAGISKGNLAAEAGLYLSSEQLRGLAAFNFEIGDHTYGHVHCRTLSGEDFIWEIDKNKATLEVASGTKVRSFSIPYGSSLDLTTALVAHLDRSGYEAIFLAEGSANSTRSCQFGLDRISIKGCTDSAFFSEIEVLPRLRTIRNLMFGAASGRLRRNISSTRIVQQASRSYGSTTAAEMGAEVPTTSTGT